MQYFFSNEQGFTLLETMISIILMTVLGIVAYGVFDYGNSYFYVGQTVTDLQRDSYAAMDIMNRDLKQGRNIVIPSLLYSNTATQSIDITDPAGNIISYHVNAGVSDLLRSTNDARPDKVLLDNNDYSIGVVFTDIDPVVSVRLWVTLKDDIVVRGTGMGNVVVGNALAWGCTYPCGAACHYDECGAGCMDLYSDIVPKNRLLGG